MRQSTTFLLICWRFGKLCYLSWNNLIFACNIFFKLFFIFTYWQMVFKLWFSCIFVQCVFICVYFLALKLLFCLSVCFCRIDLFGIYVIMFVTVLSSVLRVSFHHLFCFTCYIRKLKYILLFWCALDSNDVFCVMPSLGSCPLIIPILIFAFLLPWRDYINCKIEV